MDTIEALTPSQMASQLAESSRLDLAGNFKDWKRAVVDACAARAGGLARVSRDWPYEVQIALNYLLLLCAQEKFGPGSIARIRDECCGAFVGQILAVPLEMPALLRIAKLQADRFRALDDAMATYGPEGFETRVAELLVRNIAGPDAQGLAAASRLEASLLEFHSAMTRFVASLRLADVPLPQ